MFLNEGVHSQIVGTLVWGQIDGYYCTKVDTMINFSRAGVDVNKESHLLNLVFPYQNLGGKEESASLTKNHALIKAFLRLASCYLSFPSQLMSSE